MTWEVIDVRVAFFIWIKSIKVVGDLLIIFEGEVNCEEISFRKWERCSMLSKF